MSPKAARAQTPYALAVEQHKLVSKEFTEYFRMYMQAWSIVGSAILVGAILGLGRLRQCASPICHGLLLAAPLLPVLWFLVTSWFWGYFLLYRGYLRHLERNMGKLEDAPGQLTMHLHLYRQPWFSSRAQGVAAIMLWVVGLLVYLVMAWAVSGGFSDSSSPMRWGWFVLYLLVAGASTGAVYALVTEAHRAADKCGREGCEQE